MTVKFSIPEEELLSPGHLACQGCGSTIAMRYALKGLGKNTVLVAPACCWTILAGPVPKISVSVPFIHCPFGGAAAIASGVKAGFNARGETDTQVVVWAGDGSTFDIGLQALSGAADRNEDILYVCYDNEAYMNTGIQRSGATPWKAWTMTTPSQEGNERPKKDLAAIMQAHHIPYFATATPAFAEDMVRKFKKAKNIKGFRMIHVLSPCPPGWKHESSDTISLSKLAVQTGSFVLYEAENGKFILNMRLVKRKPISEYLSPQGRFRQLKKEDMDAIQNEVDQKWKEFESR